MGLRIVHATPTYAPAYRIGGPIRSLEGLIPRLRAAGATVRVLTTNSHGDDVLDVPRGWTERDGTPVRYVPRWLGRDLAPAYLPIAIRTLRDADVVHVTGVFSPTSVFALAAAAYARTPVVLSPRGSLQRDSLRHSSASKRLWLTTFRQLFDDVDVFHATSSKEAESIREVFPRACVRVVANGIDPGAFVAAHHDPSVVPRIGAIGRIHPDKGYDRLIEAAALLAREGLDFELRIAGPKQDPGYAQSLEDLIRARGLSGRAQLVGEVLGDAKARFFADCRVVVFASRGTENFGNVVLEALASCAPVVASKATPWQMLDEIGAGAWVEPEPTTLAQSIRRFLDDPEAARAAGERGRELVSARYGWESIAAELLDVYSEAVRMKSRARGCNPPAV